MVMPGPLPWHSTANWYGSHQLLAPSSMSTRAAKMAALRANGFSCDVTRRCKRQQLFDGMLASRFTASPRGNGAQNHREWEALLAGSIPLVDDHPALEPLWATLPIVRIRNWSLVTPEFLNHEWTRMQRRRREYSWAPVYLPYWIDRLLTQHDRGIVSYRIVSAGDPSVQT